MHGRALERQTDTASNLGIQQRTVKSVGDFRYKYRRFCDFRVKFIVFRTEFIKFYHIFSEFCWNLSPEKTTVDPREKKDTLNLKKNTVAAQ